MRLTRCEIKRRRKRARRLCALLEATLSPRRAAKARRRWKRELMAVIRPLIKQGLEL